MAGGALDVLPMYVACSCSFSITAFSWWMTISSSSFSTRSTMASESIAGPPLRLLLEVLLSLGADAELSVASGSPPLGPRLISVLLSFCSSKLLDPLLGPTGILLRLRVMLKAVGFSLALQSVALFLTSLRLCHSYSYFFSRLFLYFILLESACMLVRGLRLESSLPFGGIDQLVAD